MHCGIVKGWVSLGYNEEILLKKETSVGLFDIRKFYTGIRAKRSLVTGLGKLNGKTLVFQLSNSIAPDSNKHNDNIILYCGKRTPLPPVRITRPYGPADKWIIQDTENMVDLTFTPSAISQRNLNILICRRDYKTIAGTFEGSLLIGEGQQLKIKGFPGLAKKVRMRM